MLVHLGIVMGGSQLWNFVEKSHLQLVVFPTADVFQMGKLILQIIELNLLVFNIALYRADPACVDLLAFLRSWGYVLNEFLQWV